MLLYQHLDFVTLYSAMDGMAFAKHFPGHQGEKQVTKLQANGWLTPYSSYTVQFDLSHSNYLQLVKGDRQTENTNSKSKTLFCNIVD